MGVREGCSLPSQMRQHRDTIGIRLLGCAGCAVASVSSGGTMSNELLPALDVLAEPRKDADGAAAEVVAAGRDGDVLTEYPDPRPDRQKLVDTIARFEAAMREPLQELPAAVSGQLADLVAAIEHVEAVLAPSGVVAPEVHFAVEHIQDIAMALRQREVEATLCDTLEAAIRAVGDAIVRNDAAAARAQGAVALLRDLARRGGDLIALVAAVQTPAAEPRQHGAIAEAARQERDQFDTSHRPVTDSAAARVVDALLSDHDHAASLLQQLPSPLPDNEAPAEGGAVPALLFESAPQNAEQTDAGQNIVTASELFSIEAMAPVFVASSANEVTPHGPSAFPQPFVDAGAPAPASDPRAAPNDTLAALSALSEEELIALFS
jgi:hypothetical protein